MTTLRAMTTILAVALILSGWKTVPTCAQEGYGDGREVIIGDGTAGPYRLENRFVGGTVTVDSLTMPDLRIATSDALTSTITFDRPVAKNDSIAVTFIAPPDWLQPSYRRTVSPGASAGIRMPDYRTPTERTPRAFTGLRFGGSKSFEISTGSGREAALDQTLNLSITGNLTEDISLLASVSDQNVPISPEGTTRELDELERILIEIRGSRFSIDMGDTDLAHEGGKWLNYDRRLSGARGEVRLGNVELFGSGAVSEGRFRSATIAPVEGNQGPYPLTGGDGRTDITIIPGTERLWINGERLTRGRNNDYTVDYSTGEVTFTENRIIGSDMRIVADYEYTSDSYLRSFYSAGTGGDFLNDRLTISAVAAREADDPDRPVLGDLDAGMRRTLSLAGDADAFTDGIRPAASDTLGTYDLVDGHLVYNRGGAGEYNATFSWVGEGEGSYRYRGGGIYEWAPPGSRDAAAAYEPVAHIPRPESHAIAGITAEYAPADFIRIEAETAGSEVDLNTLSGIDDSDNGGGAYRLAFDVTPSIDGPLPLGFVIRGSRHTMGETFSSLDRDRPAEENRRWGLPLVRRNSGETINEFETGAALNAGAFDGSRIGLDGGSADFGDGAESRRIGVSGHIEVADRGAADFRVDNIERTGMPGLPDEQIDRINGNGRLDVAGFTPSLAYEHETVEGTGQLSHGTAYDEIRAGVTTPAFGPLTAEADWLYRTENARHGSSWADSSTARGGSIGLTAGSGVTGRLRTRYARRERFGSGLENTSDQAVIEGFYNPAGGSFNLDVSYRAGRTRDAVKRKNYIFAGSGNGSFRWEDENGDSVRDPDEFVPDEHGAYYLYEEILGDYLPVNMVHAYGGIEADLPGWLSRRLPGNPDGIHTETTVEINERSTADAADIFLLQLSSFRRAGVTTSGDLRFQEDVTVPVGGDGSLRLRHFQYDAFNGEYITGAERTGESSQSARLRLSPAEDTDTEITVTHAIRERRLDNYSSGNFRVRSISGEAGVSYYPRAAYRLGMTGSGGYDSDTVSGIEARYWVATPAATWFITGRGRLETSWVVTGVSLAGNTSMRLPYAMARGRREGTNHDITASFDYRLSHRMNLVVSYNGRRFAGRSFEHFARAQLRAMF